MDTRYCDVCLCINMYICFWIATDTSLFKIRVVGEFYLLHRKMRIRPRTDKLNTLLVAVTGLRQYSALEDLRLNTFAHGQEIGLPQLAIQETSFSRFEPGYGHIPIPTTSCALLLIEVNTPHIQRRALGATHGGSIAIRQRQEPLALFFHRMNQYQITATHETDDKYLVSLERLVAYGERPVDEPSALVKIPRQSIQKARPAQNTKTRLGSGISGIPCEEIIVTDTAMSQCGAAYTRRSLVRVR